MHAFVDWLEKCLLARWISENKLYKKENFKINCHSHILVLVLFSCGFWGMALVGVYTGLTSWWQKATGPTRNPVWCKTREYLRCTLGLRSNSSESLTNSEDFEEHQIEYKFFSLSINKLLKTCYMYYTLSQYPQFTFCFQNHSMFINISWFKLCSFKSMKKIHRFPLWNASSIALACQVLIFG